MKNLMQKIKEKLRSILFVQRAEVKDRWWHRLFTVLLFGTGIFVLIVAAFLAVDSYSNDWGFEYRTTAFSLEQNYEKVSGKELPCSRSLFTIKCDGANISSEDSERYGQLWMKARDNLAEQNELFKFDEKYGAACAKFPSNPDGSNLSFKDTAEFDRVMAILAPPTKMSVQERDALACWTQALANRGADPAYIAAHTAYEEALNNLPLNIKITRHVKVGAMVGDIALWIVIPLLSLLAWIVFWSAIVYRSVLYIAFGKKKN